MGAPGDPARILALRADCHRRISCGVTVNIVLFLLCAQAGEVGGVARAGGWRSLVHEGGNDPDRCQVGGLLAFRIGWDKRSAKFIRPGARGAPQDPEGAVVPRGTLLLRGGSGEQSEEEEGAGSAVRSHTRWSPHRCTSYPRPN